MTTPLQFALWIGGRRWNVAAERAHDISIALNFDGPQPNFFGAPPAGARPLTVGTFLGEVRQGGSCNCATYTLTPHCTGTHTECVGHLTRDPLAIRDVCIPPYLIAHLVSIAPTQARASSESTVPPPKPDDWLLTRAALESALSASNSLVPNPSALIVRTLPNPGSKRARRYDARPAPPYFTAEAMRWIVAQGVEHLVVDLPSIDRAEDAGRLTAHRLFFGLPAGATETAQATRPQATITELAYIDDAVADGAYLLNLQVAPFQADAAPSRPLLLPLLPS